MQTPTTPMTVVMSGLIAGSKRSLGPTLDAMCLAWSSVTTRLIRWNMLAGTLDYTTTTLLTFGVYRLTKADGVTLCHLIAFSYRKIAHLCIPGSPLQTAPTSALVWLVATLGRP